MKIAIQIYVKSKNEADNIMDYLFKIGINWRENDEDGELKRIYPKFNKYFLHIVLDEKRIYYNHLSYKEILTEKDSKHFFKIECGKYTVYDIKNIEEIETYIEAKKLSLL